MVNTLEKSKEIAKRHRSLEKQHLPLLTSSSTHVDKGWAWMVLLGSCLCHFLFRGQSTGLGVFYVEIRSSLNVSIVDVSVIGSLRNGFQNFMVIFTSPLVNHMGCRRMAIIGGVLSSAASLVCYLWPSIFTFYVFFGALTGFAHAMTCAASVMVVNNYFHEKRSFAMASLQSVASLGTLTISPVISHLLQTYGLRGSLLLNAGISLNMVVCGMLYLPQKDGKKIDVGGGISLAGSSSAKELIQEAFTVYTDKWLWRNPVFYFMLVSSTLTGLGALIPLQLLPVYMVSKGAPLDVAALSITAQGAAMTLSRFLSVILTTQYPTLVRVFYIGSGVVAGVFLYLIPISDTSTAYILFASGFAFCFGCLSGLVTVLLIDLFGTERLPACFGLSYMVSGVGNLIGTPLASSVAELVPIDGVEYILAGSVIIVCGLIMLPTLFPWQHKNEIKYERLSLLPSSDNIKNAELPSCEESSESEL